MKQLTIIDTFGFFFRAYYALPPLRSKSGFPTGLLTGFVNFLGQIFSQKESEYLAFALESKEKGFREELYKEYKANRQEPPEELRLQLPIAIEWIEKMGFKNLSIASFEADDVIASLAQKAKEAGIRVKIVSSDKDLYQLIDDDFVVLFDPVKKLEINEAECIKKWGVRPKDFVEFQSILGDSSDNIPGIRGIGEKGASKLINEYGTLEAIYANIDNIKPDRIRNLLIEGKENAFLSRELVRLKRDLFDSFDFNELLVPNENPLLKIADELAKYDMNSALSKIAKEIRIEPKNRAFSFSYELVSSKERLFAILDSLAPNQIIALDTETDSLDTKSARLVGFSFATSSNKGYYVPIAHNYLGVGEQIDLDSAKEALKILLTHPIIGHNLKFDLSLIYRIFGLDKTFKPSEQPLSRRGYPQWVPQSYRFLTHWDKASRSDYSEGLVPFMDTMILAWLVNPEASVGLDNLMSYYFNHKMIYYEDVVKKGANFASVDVNEACKYAVEDACASYTLYEKLVEILRLQNAEHLINEAKEVELPFINTLIEMENRGIKIDIEFFEKLLVSSKEALEVVSDEIYKLAGITFNLNSTQQLAEVLYNKLNLKPLKKTKTGYSTNEAVLEELKDEHPIIPKILEYRELFKLKSTYIEPLLEYAKKDKQNRIYTSFLQTGTATGRLSSKNPNLQNIPVKTELGRKIRDGFISEDGYLLVSIDYSQIELRLLAHFSQDSALCEAFKEGRDIHLETAIKLFGNNKAKEMRNIAKSINFGLIYGMGARKLSDQIKVSQKEAKSYIDAYFASFPTVKGYLKSIEEFALKEGYTETLLKRRRYFDFNNASEYQKAGYLREAINTVFQGSAADLIKLAMNKISSFLKDKDAYMLLQIHDELLFEIKENKANLIAKEIANIMESIYPLHVPLKCSINIGKRWGELK